jgi:hypothetical protein
MVSELCLKYKCKECPGQVKCVGCEHNYILIKQETVSNLYKCSKCGNKLRLNKNNVCCECINNCKGKVKSEIDKENNIYRKCNKFNKGGKEDED